MEIAALTFSIPIAALAAALIGRLESLWITLASAFVIGIIQSELNAFSGLAEYRNMTPFVCAILVLLWFGWRDESKAGSPDGRRDRRRRGHGADTAQARTPMETSTPACRRWCRRRRRARIVTLMIVFLVLLFRRADVLSSFWLQIALQAVIYRR